jgi:transcriptional regulator with XRE-family HTH domain
VLELTALLNAEISVTEIILQALEARIVGLKKVVWLRCALNRIELNKAEPHMSTLRKLAKALDVDPIELVGE